MTTRRTGWDDLSPSSKKRLLGAGRSGKLSGTPGLSEAETRAYWESGYDLRGAYGHKPKAKGAAPKDATDRAVFGLSTTADASDLEKWRRSSAPAWIPSSTSMVGDDTAAILSQIDLPPRRWREVRFIALDDGRVQLIISPKGRGYDRVVFLPDRDSMSEVARMIGHPVPADATPSERKRLERQWSAVSLKVNAQGSETARPAAPANGVMITKEPPPGAPSAGKPSRKALPGSSSAQKTRSTPGGMAGSPKAKKRTAGQKASKPGGKKRQTQKARPQGQAPSVADQLDEAISAAESAVELTTEQIQAQIQRLQKLLEGR